MADESSSTIAVVPPRHPSILIGTDLSQNLVILNVSAQEPLKITTTNYSVWQLQFTSLIFKYNLLGFVDGSTPCPPKMITLPDAASPSQNVDHILWLP